jgi:hypothetical protein
MALNAIHCFKAGQEKTSGKYIVNLKVIQVSMWVKAIIIPHTPIIKLHKHTPIIKLKE